MPQITSYEWDEENRLIGVTRPDGSSEAYEYSGEGQRRAKTVTSGGLSEVTKYVWDNQNVLQETDGAGAVKAHYTDSPGHWGGLTSVRLAGSTPCTSGAQFNAATFGSARFNQASAATDTGSRFFLFDQQASTRHLTDASGNVSDAYIYRAFGEEVQSSGTTPNPMRFHGQYGARKDSSSQIDMRARVYDQTTGVWRSPDPIGFFGGDYNLYRFVHNNPPILRDPSGLDCVGPSISVPLPPVTIGPLTCSPTIGICAVCYNCNKCPIPPEHQDEPNWEARNSRQWCAQISLGASCTLVNPAEFLKYLKNTIGIQEDLAKLLLQPNAHGLISVSVYNSSTGPGLPIACAQGCPPKGVHLTGNGCFTGCAVSGSGSACFQGGLGGSWSFDFSYGICGIPSIGFSFDMELCF